MVLRRTETEWAVQAPAKLNLYLEVLGRRDDGFHEVETLAVPVRLCDELLFRPQPTGIDLQIDSQRTSADAIPADDANLVVRAVRLLAERADCERGASITLRKRIPAMAGLGGGSSDAAAALLAANAAWRLGWTIDQLHDVASEIGSDVPFFLAGGAAVCSGRGERVEPTPLPAGIPCVVLQPPRGLATSEVYSHVDLKRVLTRSQSAARLSRLTESLCAGDWRGLATGLHNRLQEAAAQISPWVKRLATAFGRLPFVAHQLTGSGAAYFGLCRHGRQARALAAQLASQQLGRVFVTRTCR
jgi:4-diphosphocytidyl-2-C-methyl-D-erythritol kinase